MSLPVILFALAVSWTVSSSDTKISTKWFKRDTDYARYQPINKGDIHLSQNTSVCLPDESCWSALSSRWNAVYQPQLDAIVSVVTELDVAAVIKFANAHDRPFLAISGTHGATEALGIVEHGIGILMRSFNHVDLNPDGQSATIGGGALADEVWTTLWEQGKQVVTGICACTGFIAPLLGGGHGWLQGRFGLLADNLLSARLVLANGTLLTASATEHPDLFWALRGAGHNFGIVTSVEYRVHDRTPEQDTWSLETFFFGQDKLEEVFSAAGDLLSTGEHTVPIELTHWIYFLNVPELDKDKAVIMLLLVYQGSSIPDQYTTLFHALSPLTSQTSSRQYLDLASAALTSRNDPGCQPGSTWLRYPIGLRKYPIKGSRQAYDIFASLPSQMNGSLFAFEAYSMQGVQAVAAETTAVPDRFNNLIISPFITFSDEEGEGGNLTTLAKDFANRMRESIVEDSGQELNAYVNYANGDEGLQAIYGYEEWRLGKLRALKRAYDPLDRFGYYAPITEASS